MKERLPEVNKKLLKEQGVAVHPLFQWLNSRAPGLSVLVASCAAGFTVFGIVASINSALLSVERQADASRNLAVAQRKEEARSVALAIRAELQTACITLAAHQAAYFAITRELETAGEAKARELLKSITPLAFDQRVYEANINKIGMIDGELAARVVTMASTLKLIGFPLRPLEGRVDFARNVWTHLVRLGEIGEELRDILSVIPSGKAEKIITNSPLKESFCG